MGLKNFYQKHENKILASALVLFLLLVIGLRYDYYYDLNDDVVMKDILAGVYTGIPEGHNIQMLYPLSLLLSLLYRLFPNAPVYGIFLCVCQYGCLWLFAERSLHFRSSTLSKIGVIVVEGSVIVTLVLSHLVFVQYTFVCAMLVGVAAFLFVTAKTQPVGSFIKSNLPAILLCVLAYMLRTEMMLLLLPLVCVAGVYRWSMEAVILEKANFCKYIAVIGGILLGMLLATIMHTAAFSSEEWKEYVAYFDSRTELYDFQGIPSYEGNEALYEELGMTKAEQHMLLEQYNFGLDDTLEAEELDQISAYQAEHKAQEQSFISLLIEKGETCLYRMLHKEPAGSLKEDDYPWNIMVILGYMAVLITLIWSHADSEKQSVVKIGAGIAKLVFLFAVRTALWMFILMRGRDPVRITHSLYMVEFFILLGMLHVEAMELAAKIAGRVRATVIFPLVFGVTAISALGSQIAEVDKAYADREIANTVDGGMKEYCRSHEDNFYFMDVYSAVSYPLEPYAGTVYSEKMFTYVDNSLGNYDLMGGWLVKSPSYKEKLAAFGMDSMSSGLLEKENVYMMAELAKGTEYIEAYFMDQGELVEVKLTDTICDLIGVYKINKAGGGE